MEQPPDSITHDLKAYLVRVLNDINSKLLALDKVQATTALPTRPVIGKIYYFSNTIMPTITSVGFWGYKASGWVFLG